MELVVIYASRSSREVVRDGPMRPIARPISPLPNSLPSRILFRIPARVHDTASRCVVQNLGQSSSVQNFSLGGMMTEVEGVNVATNIV